MTASFSDLWTTGEILEATGGKLLCGDASASVSMPSYLSSYSKRGWSGISIDSRNISDKELFVAVKGNVHDGHSFVREVVRKGVCGLCVSEDFEHAVSAPEFSHLIDILLSILLKLAGTGDIFAEWGKKGVVCIAVKNTTKALGDLAAFHRKRCPASVVAITGSNGKTSAREMTVAVMRQRFHTLSPQKNFNNEIGLPLTLLELKISHEWAVLELGMNRHGEIARLTEICSPDIGMITNIGPAHLEGVGSIEGVMRAKGELIAGMKPGGIAVLNADDPGVLECGKRNAQCGIVLYSAAETFSIQDALRQLGNRKLSAFIRAFSVKAEAGGVSFMLSLPEAEFPVHLGTPGRFMVSNALAATSAGFLAGLSAREIKAGLESFRPVAGRLNLIRTDKGFHVIDDTYNANPASMRAALTTLAELRGNHRGIFVAGDMFELGNNSESMHRELGSFAAGTGISKLYATGRFAETLASGAVNQGMNARDIFTGTKAEIIAHLKSVLEPGDRVLVKGSRASCMEEITEGIRK
jgi:UDP-N-acetylmuramoyl-tripeptide--D-alanyl-D-alanine ligase